MMCIMNETPAAAPPLWQKDVFAVLKKRGIQPVAYAPDSGHSHTMREAQRSMPSSTDGRHRPRADTPEEVEETVDAALDSVFEAGERIDVLLGQKVIGRKQ
jgi:hypothetical protein